MSKARIIKAIEKARKGISQYLEIMALLPTVNVARNRDFQRKYNAFYRVRQRPSSWYREYFSVMQRLKNRKPRFEQVLDHFNKTLARYEPSFSSKLAATLNPALPVWDKFVLRNTCTKMPAYSSKKKMEQAKVAYGAIQKWNEAFLRSREGKLVLRIFKQKVPEHTRITDLKKIDFVLWQMRQ